tara:strand:+ start:1366 stop:1650 length:285 start_codon:yes stop_codon:yes gene_type:complete
MALKRRVEKSYSLDEMFTIINKKFINRKSDDISKIPHYVISPTCFETKGKEWLVADSRDSEYFNHRKEDELGVYYGSTIIEAVTKCFLDIKNNG